MASPKQSKGTPWIFQIPLPRAAQTQLKRYALDTGCELRDIGVEMVREWAERHGVQVTIEEQPQEDASADDSEDDAA